MILETFTQEALPKIFLNAKCVVIRASDELKIADFVLLCQVFVGCAGYEYCEYAGYVRSRLLAYARPE